MNTVKTLINKLELIPHPEGGYYKQTFISDISVQLDDKRTRKINTAIYYLLESDDFSCWHRLKSNEIWHYYSGSSLTIYEINARGELSHILLGNPMQHEGALPQHIIWPNTWFAARVNQLNTFSLVGCTVSPGFDFADFTIGSKEEMLAQFPKHEKTICQLSRALKKV
ncbi:MAG: cupin domain-containing protein [Pseudomonadota bacterium]